MIQNSAKPINKAWEVGERKYQYQPLSLYELFEKRKDGSDRKMPMYWLTYVDTNDKESGIAHITDKTVETREKFVETLKHTIASNKKGKTMQEKSLSKVDKNDIETQSALQNVIDNYEERIDKLESALESINS